MIDQRYDGPITIDQTLAADNVMTVHMLLSVLTIVGTVTGGLGEIVYAEGEGGYHPLAPAGSDHRLCYPSALEAPHKWMASHHGWMT